MRLVKAATACILILVLSLSAATQFIASVFAHHPALGPRLAVSDNIAVYPPWAILEWSGAHGAAYPRPFRLAEAILYAGGLAASAAPLFVFSCRISEAQHMRPELPWDAELPQTLTPFSRGACRQT